MMRGVMERGNLDDVQVTGVRTLVQKNSVFGFDSTNQTEQLHSKRGAPTLSFGKVLTQKRSLSIVSTSPIPQTTATDKSCDCAAPIHTRARSVFCSDLHQHKIQTHRPWGGLCHSQTSFAPRSAAFSPQTHKLDYVRLRRIDWLVRLQMQAA